MNMPYSPDGSSVYPAGGLAPSDAPGGLDLQSVIRAVRRRLNLMAGVFLCVFALATLFTLTLKPRYTATSSVIVNTQSAKVIDIGAVMQGLAPNSAVIDTEAEILKSRSLLSKVVKRLDLVENPEFNPARVPPSGMDQFKSGLKSFIKSVLPGGGDEATDEALSEEDILKAEQAELDGVIAGVQGAISINRLGPTYIIEINATSSTPDMAALLANTVADVYLDNQLETKFDATRRAKSWLDDRVVALRDEVREAESKVEAHRARTGLLSAEGSTLTEQAIRDLNAQLTVQQADLAEKRARLQNVQNQLAAGGGVDTISEALASGNISALRVQQAEILRRKADLRARYLDGHPDVIRVLSEERDVDRQISAELQRIVSALEQDVLVSRERVNALQSRLNSQKGELAVNNRASVVLNELQRDADASRALYEEFLNRFKETSELDGITEADALINAYAATPTGPSFPNTTLNLALGFILGAALAGLAGLIVELMDSFFSSPEDVEQYTGAPYLVSVPLLAPSGTFAKARIKPADYLLEKPHSGYAEAFRNLRASILFADVDHPAKTVAVVSSLPDEGKTSMTYCLGRMAAMSGTKTIVIDGDIRRRQLTEVSGVPAEAGLLEYLFGESRLSDVIVTDEATGLHILPLADRKHTPKDVFGSRAFDALMTMLKQTYDLIIIDTGPVLLMAETRVVTRKVDQVVVAARWRKTNRATLRETLKILREFKANVAGVALTFVDLRRRGQYAYTAADYKAYRKYYTDD